MTTDDAAADVTMHELLMRLLGEFSHLQDYLDELVAKRFLEVRIPAASKFFTDRAIKRIKDEERADLLLAIAKDLNSDAALASFRAVFNRVKKLRDRCAHSARITPGENGVLVIEKSVITWHEQPIERATVSRSELIQAIHECRWLEAQAAYVCHSGRLYNQLRLGTVLIEPVKPTERPEDWDGVTYRSVDE
ncbi:hypothetical protein SEA_RUBEELU_57 [Mycobacterium phage Rubeelu]|uniref:Uncharacterized protein n=1 Tax=Mycobacterium phage Rubeelu TaxID=2250386 RepID=A0A2Z5HG97_9CAUD|nr:hypothetical protein SEA_RUBEELU_57 [Mycobacterium phage Rubeelu]